MKRPFALRFFLLFFIVITSCQEKRNIAVRGSVLDEVTGKPISNAEVVVICWHSVKFDESSFEKQILVTDSNGNFKANFGNGYQVDVAAKALGYLPFRSYNELNTNTISVDLTLAKKRNNPSLEAFLIADDTLTHSENEPNFLRVSVPADKGGNNLDFGSAVTFGYDLKTRSTNADTTQVDLWFRTIKKEGQPTTIAASRNGGLIPILDKEVKSSLLFEKMVAPTSGYRKTYQLMGDEAGFFILCRDGKTYGKIILERAFIDKSMPDGQGSFYKEFGMKISSLYQPNGSRDLSYNKEDLDLEDFLVDSRFR